MSGTRPHALLLSAAPAALRMTILKRVTPEMRLGLIEDGSTPGLVPYAIAHGTEAERSALAGKPGVPPDDLLALAAATSGPAMAATLFGNAGAPREAMLRVMPLVPDADLLPRARPRNDPMLLDTARRVSVAVESENPEVVAAALRLIDGEILPLGPAVVLRGCLGLLWTAGRDAAWQALRAVRDEVGGGPGGGPGTGSGGASGGGPRADLSAPVRDAFADPFAPASIGRALAYETAPAALVERLRRCRSRDEAVVELHAPRGPIDWDFVVGEHRREPLPGFVRAALDRQAGCPDVFGQAPPRMGTAEPEGPPQRGPFVEPPRRGGARLVGLADEAAVERVREDYRNGVLSAEEVAAEGDPAFAALDVLASRAVDPDPQVRAVVADLARPALGGDAEAWAVALNLLGDFAGTLPELLATAAAVTD